MPIGDAISTTLPNPWQLPVRAHTQDLVQARRRFHVCAVATAGLLAPLAAGGTVILPAAGRFTASTFWQDCCMHGATFYTAVPTIHQVRARRAGAAGVHTCALQGSFTPSVSRLGP